MKYFPPSILRPPRLKRVPQEVKLGVGMLPSPVPILTVDDTRLPRMQLQSTLLEAPLDAGQDLLRLFLRPAVRHNIVCVTFERNIRMRLLYP